MFKKIWNDPVGSKVISAIIISAGAFLISLIYGAMTDNTLEDSLMCLWLFEVRLSYTLIVLFILLLIRALFQKLSIQKLSKTEKLANKFHNKYRKIEDNTNGLNYRFNAYISDMTNFPFISDLRVYCTLHGGETLTNAYSGCPQRDCSRHGVGYNERGLKEQIETDLLGMWEEMNK